MSGAGVAAAVPAGHGPGQGSGHATPEPGHLSQRDFQRLADYIEQYSGIKMPPSKMTMVEGRLRRRLRATGHATLRDYCSFLFDKGGLAAEAVHLIDAVTTNKTEFFREPEHFRLLVRLAIPELLAAADAPRRPLTIWSAACSIGAEPYTLAMVLADLARSSVGLRWSILATDLSTEALRAAADGIYPAAMVAPVPAEYRQRYVMRAKDRSRDQVRIVPELRAMVRFGRANLMDAQYPMPRDLDIVFCRNVLIYFDKPTQQAVLQRLVSHLRPGGFLFLGHSETLAGFHLPLDVVGPTMFRRR
jgi:chemotaxis protein methyltransferase CheR